MSEYTDHTKRVYLVLHLKQSQKTRIHKKHGGCYEFTINHEKKQSVMPTVGLYFNTLGEALTAYKVTEVDSVEIKVRYTVPSGQKCAACGQSINQ